MKLKALINNSGNSRKYEIFRAIFIKHIKEKFRQKLITTVIFLWPFFIFFVIFKSCFVFDKPNVEKGYYNERHLPSSGMGPFLYGMLCISHDPVEYEDLYSIEYENSRFKKFFGFYEHFIGVEDRSRVFLDLVTTVTNTLIFLGIHVEENPKFNLKGMIAQEGLLLGFSAKVLKKISFADDNINKTKLNFRYWLFKSAIDLFKVIKELPNNELLELIEDFLNIKDFDINNINIYICQRSINYENLNVINGYIEKLKKLPLDIMIPEKPKLSLTDMFNYHKLNRSELNDTIQSSFEKLYKVKNGNVLLMMPDVDFIRILSQKYNEFFINILTIIEYLNDNHQRFSMLRYYSKYLLKLYLDKYPTFDISNVSDKSFKLMKRVLGLLPIKSRVVDHSSTGSKIFDPLTTQSEPLLGLNFSEYKKNYSYSILFHSYLSSTNTDPWKQPLDRMEHPAFYFSTMSLVQDIIDSIIIKHHFKDRKIVNITKKFNNIPKDCYEKPQYFIMYAYAIPIVFMVVQLPPLAYTLFYLWNEKNNQILEYMNLINVDSTIYLLQNRIIDFIITIFPYIPVLIVFRYAEIINYTNYTTLFIYMFVILISSNSFFMLSASFFKDSSIAMVVSFIIFLIGSIVSLRVKMDVFIPHTIIHKLLQILAYVPICQFFDSVLYIEYFMKRGLTMADLFTHHLPFEPYPMIYYIFIILGDGLLYLLIELLLKNIYKKPALTFNYIKENINKLNKPNNKNLLKSVESENGLFDDAGVSFDNVYIGYNKHNCVFKNLSINLFYDNIYVILGENGSGKSTFIKSILGLLKPISGKINIKSRNLDHKPRIGFCSQYNMLIYHLTVEEHLLFYYTLKTGYGYNIVKNEINTLLSNIGLSNVSTTFAKSLSGGEKRKLSIGISLINDPDILICDEPTSAVDPGSRKPIYDIINKNKTDKIIIITTHHIDEAETLSDEILFLFYGKFYTKETIKDICSNTNQFLKLTIEFDTNNVDSKMLVETINKICPHIIDTKIKERDITFILNQEKKYSAEFEELLSYITNNASDHNIKSWYLNDSSLEEVFIDICKYKNKDLTELKYYSDDQSYLHSTDADYKIITEALAKREQVPTIFSHISLLVKNKLKCNLKNTTFYLLQFVLPMVITIITCYILNSLSNTTPHLDVANVHTFSKHYKLYIPIFYDNYNLESQTGNILNLILDDYVDGISTLKNFENMIIDNDICCKKNNTNVCFVNEIPREEINKCDSKFPTIPHKTDNCKIHLIKNCNSYQYLLYSRFNHIYEQLFSLNFKEKNDRSEITMILNRESGLSLPYALNYINNIIFQLNSLINNEETIPSINVKFNISGEGAIHRIRNRHILNNYAVLLIVMAYVVMCSYISLEIINERVSGYKFTLYKLGINNISYWCSIFIFNWIYYAISAILCMFVFIYMKVSGISDTFAIKILIITSILFGFSSIPIQYIFSFRIKSGSFSYVISTLTNFIALIFTHVTRDWAILEILNDVPPKDVNYFKLYADRILHCFPVYYVYDIITKLLNSEMKFPKIINTNFEDFYSDFLGILIVGIVLWVWCIFRIFVSNKIKFAFIERIIINMLNKKEIKEIYLHDSVVDEKDFVIKNANKTNSHILIRGLNKIYYSIIGRKSIRAIKDINFTLRKNECLCLLGKNGAGKSTIFKILVGDEMKSTGNILMFKEELNSIFYTYCPQTNNMDPNMTPKQILRFLCKIYGYNYEITKIIVKKLIYCVGLKNFKNTKIKNINSGSKRRLSVAICIIGNPSVIMLDEPTAGVDPSARYMIWNLLYYFKKTGKSILFTSHNMRECEIYGERIVLLHKGTLKCIGSPEYIKKSFNLEYQLHITGNEKSLLKLEINLINEFSKIKIKHDNQGMKVIIEINQQELLSLIKILNNERNNGNIINYRINQAGMENIFSDNYLTENN